MMVLQWGRDQLIAELLQDKSNKEEEGRLQWGRDQLIAELRRICQPVAAQSGFNGAAIN